MGTSEPSIEVVATGLAAGGDALARADDGRVVFVAGALPGERVVARVVDTRRDFLRAETIEVLDASADRVAPRHSACGGCTWQHVAATAQPGLKVGIVVDALRRIAGLVDVPVVARPGTFGRSLRTTVRLGVGADGRAGERRRGTHEVVPASPGCAALHPALAELVRESRFPASASEVVLRVGVASGERAAHVDAAGPAERSSLPSDVQVGPEAVVHEEVAGAWLQVSIRSFFQPGPVAAGELVAAVDEAVGDALPAGGHLLDAYAGVGLFGATVGSRRSAGRVTAVEISRPAVADARVNLARAGVDGRVVRSEVARWRPTATPDPAIDVVVADPARTGLGRPGVAAVAAAGVDRLVLVSCDPASLARDTALLAGSGFALRRVELVDAFPDTFHVEAVARFDRC
ncbi:MAG TPA: TRAM domain-containing protein [Acidimicrobiales bacterium]|nr:TRAM domain-containing protein [Acidimicrobiales bacterium]